MDGGTTDDNTMFKKWGYVKKQFALDRNRVIIRLALRIKDC